MSYAHSLFPYGKSGLKFISDHGMNDGNKSLPVWEEWIEIARENAKKASAEVSSRMGRVD